MSVPPNVFPNSSNFAYNIVVGGHKNDKPSDESGTLKVVDPLRHSVSGYPHEQMPFVTMLRSPTQSALEETPFPPEPGTVVAVSWTTGDPTTRAVVGQPNELNNSQNISGNDMISGHLQQAMGYLTGKRLPPQKTQEKTDRGAVVREKVERSGEWKHELTRGLATHAAWYPMAGQVLAQVKNIDTAVQTFANIPSLSSMAGIGGSGMNLASLFKKLTRKQKREAAKNMDPLLLEGLENMFNLMSETEAGGTYISSGRVDEATFIANMVSLLSQCTNMSDVLAVLMRLRTDSTLHGLDKIAPITFKANTAYGELSQTMDYNGNVSSDSKSQEIVQAALKALQGLMGSNQSGAKGKYLFGEAGELMSKSFDRIPPGIRKEIVQKTAELTESFQHNELHRRTLGDSDPRPLALFG